MTSVSPVRLVLGAAGLGAVGWGVFSLLDDTREALTSLAVWLVAGVVIHDAVIAPLTLAVLFVGGRVLPPWTRGPAALGFAVWATCSVAFFTVLVSPGKPGNPTLLDRDYALSWLLFTAVSLMAVAVASWTRRPKSSSAG